MVSGYRKLLPNVVTLALAAQLLAGCGGGSGDNTGPGIAQVPAAPTE